MSVEKVTANVNKQIYPLTKVGETDTYKASISAPFIASDYSIAIKITDDAGNETIVDATDPKFGELLKLAVGDFSVDLRQLILTNELGDRMLDMVAPIYDKSKVTLYLFQTFGIVLEKEMDFILGDFINQIFPQTATWGLKYWEDEFGVVTDESKTIKQRRNYLLSVMYKKRPMTPKRLKQIVKGVTGFEADIVENIAHNTFLVIIRGYVTNLNPVTEELNKKVPAHLNYTIRMSELVKTYAATSSGFAVSECERYELEVLQ